MSRSVVTLQKHIRGWITRKKYGERQKLIAREREREKERLRILEMENRKNQKESAKQGIQIDL